MDASPYLIRSPSGLTLGPAVRAELDRGVIPYKIYKFIRVAFDSLGTNGAYRANSLGGDRARRTLRWNSECAVIQSRRRITRKRYLTNKTNEEMAAFKRMANKVKIQL